MKRNLLLILLCTAFSLVRAQGLDITTKEFDGGSIMVIKPTISTFITLLNYDEEQFKAAMEKCQYSNQPPRGNFITYWNGSPDNFSYAKCVNTYLYNKEPQEVHYAVGVDMVYPQGSIAALYHDLKPFKKDDAEPERREMPDPGWKERADAEKKKDAIDAPERDHRRPFGRGFGRRGSLDVYEVPVEDATYEFRIAAYPRFFYIVVSRK